MGEKHLYNIPATRSFTDTLAFHYSEQYADNPAGLSGMLFLVPSRRVASSLKDAFIRHHGLSPLLLPCILPIADVGEDDVFFLKADTKNILEHLPPSIDEYERLFLFARLIVSRPQVYGLLPMSWGQAFALAGDLAKLVDTAYEEHLSLEALETLVPDQYAEHWQETLKFLKIVMSYWPDILKERNVIDRAERREAVLQAQTELLKKYPPSFKIVTAGMKGSTPAEKELLSTIASLPDGEVILYQLDRFLQTDDGEQIDENHPQYELLSLLSYLNVRVEDVPDLYPPVNEARERLVSQTMLPACQTWQWLELRENPLPSEAVDHLRLLSCADARQEALSIALILRQTLNTPEKTAALVTTDRKLARRTAMELERWSIKIDDSAGKPLHLKPVGIFLRLMMQVLDKKMSDVSLLALLKNPLANAGSGHADWRSAVRRWEKLNRLPKYQDNPTIIPEDLVQKIEAFKKELAPLEALYTQKSVAFSELLETHLRVAEKLAGAEFLWRGDDGRTAASLFSRILPFAETVGEIDPEQYPNLLTMILSRETVRSSYGSHPRIKILGPIEARFNHFDTVILGEVNEGIWPESSSGDPWLSRPMKKEFGMPLPERHIGIMAGDFCQLLCAPEVFLTRALRSGGTPMNKSRWLLRLETVLEASGYDRSQFYDRMYDRLSLLIDQARRNIRIEPPSPCPPVEARPRRFSASTLETLVRDPYEVYASKILKLPVLDDHDPKPNLGDYGTFVHRVLEKFVDMYPSDFPPDAREILISYGCEVFRSETVTPEVRAFWWPKFVKTIDWFIAREKEHRPDLRQAYAEARGEIAFDAPAGIITLEARADRLDLTREGHICVLDYKTGQIRSAPQMESGYAPQLPLEGIIAENGGFVRKKDGALIPKASVDRLIYWQLGKKEQVYKGDTALLLENNFDRIKRYLSAYDLPTTPYLARPNSSQAPSYPKYAHLERLKEWITGENDDE